MLQQLDDDLWCAETQVRLAAGLHFPARMVVARLADGDIWLHSPIELDDVTAAELEALGPVRHLVAPNNFHHLHLRGAKARFPDARIHASAALEAKRAPLTVDQRLEPGAPSPWGPSIDTLHIAGAKKIDEFVFFHRPSRTLIVSDLLFNIHEAPALTPLTLRVLGCWRRLAQSRSWRMFIDQAGLAAQSAEALLRWDFTRVVVGHGRVLEGPQVHGEVEAALSKMRGG